MQFCSRSTVLSLAAALAVGTSAFAQTPPEAQNPVMPQSGNTGGRVPPAKDDKGGGMTNGGMTNMAPAASANMEADMVVNSQRMKFAMSPETMGDQAFALEAAGGNMAEIELAKTISMKTTEDKCKMLAKTIMDEHQMAQDKLKPIAEKLGVKLPTALPTMHQAHVTALKNMSPEMATKAFLSMMKQDHLKTVAMYTDKAPVLKDSALKAYAMETLPHIRSHTAKILEANQMMQMPLDLNFKADDHGGM